MNLTQFKEKVAEFIIHLDVERNVSLHTLRAYEGDLHLFVIFWETLTPDEQANLSCRQIIERYLVSLHYKKMDNSSIARKYSCFRSFSKYLETRGVSLPLTLKRPRIDKKLVVYLSVDEMLHLLDQVQEHQLPSQFPLRDKTILELLYATGIRCSELVNIKLQDIDMHNKLIRIYGKGRKERLVLFGDKAKMRLEQFCANERPPMQRPDEPLFLNYRHEQLTTRSIQRIIQMFRQFLKVQRPITPHKIRHSFATHLVHQGVDLRVVQELLGHQLISSTEKYTHVTLEELTRQCDELHPLNSMMKKKEHA